MLRHEVIDREFLEIRARLLQVAASLDRIDRAESSGNDDARLGQIHDSLAVLGRSQSNRAEAIQLIFSHPFDHNWRQSLGVSFPSQQPDGSHANNGSPETRK